MKSILAVTLWILASAPFANAEMMREPVNYEAGGTQLRGHILWDDSIEARRPGVLVVHEWWGLNDHALSKASELAKAGYVAFALDMYGDGKQTEHPKEAGEWSGAIGKNAALRRERFEAARHILATHPKVAAGKLAAIGYCFGGNVVLKAAFENAALLGVASFHGSLPQEPATLSSVAPKILVLHGAADPFISSEQVATFQKHADAAGADWQFVAFGGVKHSFTNPTADSRGMEALAYSESADRRSWAMLLEFFEELFQ